MKKCKAETYFIWIVLHEKTHIDPRLLYAILHLLFCEGWKPSVLIQLTCFRLVWILWCRLNKQLIIALCRFKNALNILILGWSVWCQFSCLNICFFCNLNRFRQYRGLYRPRRLHWYWAAVSQAYERLARKTRLLSLWGRCGFMLIKLVCQSGRWPEYVK